MQHSRVTIFSVVVKEKIEKQKAILGRRPRDQKRDEDASAVSPVNCKWVFFFSAGLGEAAPLDTFDFGSGPGLFVLISG